MTHSDNTIHRAAESKQLIDEITRTAERVPVLEAKLRDRDHQIADIREALTAKLEKAFAATAKEREARQREFVASESAKAKLRDERDAAERRADFLQARLAEEHQFESGLQARFDESMAALEQRNLMVEDELVRAKEFGVEWVTTGVGLLTQFADVLDRLSRLMIELEPLAREERLRELEEKSEAYANQGRQVRAWLDAFPRSLQAPAIVLPLKGEAS